MLAVAARDVHVARASERGVAIGRADHVKFERQSAQAGVARTGEEALGAFHRDQRADHGHSNRFTRPQGARDQASSDRKRLGVRPQRHESSPGK